MQSKIAIGNKMNDTLLLQQELTVKSKQQCDTKFSSLLTMPISPLIWSPSFFMFASPKKAP